MEIHSNASKSVKFENLWVISNTLHNGLSEQVKFYNIINFFCNFM